MKNNNQQSNKKENTVIARSDNDVAISNNKSSLCEERLATRQSQSDNNNEESSSLNQCKSSDSQESSLRGASSDVTISDNNKTPSVLRTSPPYKEGEEVTKISPPLKEEAERWSNNKAFKKWSEKKEYIHKNRNPVYARRKEMWWCAVGCNIGFEQDGKNNYFERPVLILKRFNKHLILTVSLSSVVKKDNPYYYKYILKNIEYSVILSQVRVMSSKRLLRKYGMMPAKDFINIQKAISGFCK